MRTSKYRSILEELNGSPEVEKEQFIETRAKHLIASSKNLIDLITESYDDETSADLIKRLINSIRTGDENKFIRGIKHLNEDNK